MDFVNKNIKKISVFNIGLLVVAFILNFVYLLNNNLSTINVVTNIISLCAIVAGLFYTLQDYKKKAANYYKTYIALYSLSRLVYTIAEYSYSMKNGASYFSAILNTITVICGFALLIKDLGKKTSLTLAYILLILVLINAVISVAMYPNSIYYNAAPAISTTCITVIFVLAKYANKRSRGII